jgi:very-short-patch-repair endonuclease
MKVLLIVMAVLLVLLAVTTAALKKAAKKAKQVILARELLTGREQAMYFRLLEALPDHVILAQVSFGAMLTAKGVAARNTFDRKIADFVVCSKAFQTEAVIELDDSSHRNKAENDAARDAVLAVAGIRTIRYKNVPDVETVRRDFAAPRPVATTRDDALSA